MAALSDATSFVYRSLSTSTSTSTSSTADPREGTSTFTTVLDIATTALRLKNVLGVDLSSWKKPAPIAMASGKGGSSKGGKPMKKIKPQPVKRAKPQPVKKGAKRVPRGGGGGSRSSSSSTSGTKKKSEGGGMVDALSVSLGSHSHPLLAGIIFCISSATSAMERERMRKIVAAAVARAPELTMHLLETREIFFFVSVFLFLSFFFCSLARVLIFWLRN